MERRCKPTDDERKPRYPNWKRMEELRSILIKRGDPLNYVERGKMMLGWTLSVRRLPQ